MKLGLESGSLPDNFTTAFIMTYHPGGCSANCSFCPQSNSSKSDSHLLSRIGWPQYRLEEVAKGLQKQLDIQRICIQSLNYSHVVDDVLEIIDSLKSINDAKISLCIHPIPRSDMLKLKDAGIDRIGIAIDACTQTLFDEIKGRKRDSSYTWNGHIAAIKEAQAIFGKENVTTHLIVGMGESESEIVKFLFDMNDMHVRVGLFAFTPVEGTDLAQLEQPDLGKYRRTQILRELIARGKIARQEVTFDDSGQMTLARSSEEILDLLSSGTAFQVTGCPGCNRPYYNERPRGPMYNYPKRLTEEEKNQAIQEAGLVN